MSGTHEGGLKAAMTNKARYGKDYYRIQGQKGGQNGYTGGFCSMTPEKRAECGRKGGLISRRGPAKPGQIKPKVKTYTPPKEVFAPTMVVEPEPKPWFKRFFRSKNG